jgi:hypothetical protein
MHPFYPVSTDICLESVSDTKAAPTTFKVVVAN